MKEKYRIELIKSPVFLVGLALLILNDFYFKYEFSNDLTGKLSDLAGLFIFPFFFSTLFPKRALQIYFLTAGLFVFWGSELSQNLINFSNGFGIGINRTIDYTDFFTLSILPLSYIYFKDQLNSTLVMKRITTVLISSTAIFSFFATTLPRQNTEFKILSQKSYALDADKSEFFTLINAAHGYSKSFQQNQKDSLFYLYYYVPELRTDMTVLAKIRTNENNKLEILLESFIEGYLTGSFFTGIDEDELDEVNQLSKEDLELLFETHFINALFEPSKSSQLYYDNKQIHDERLRQFEETTTNKK